MVTYDEINRLWFSDEVKPLWFNSTPEFDRFLREQYQDCWQQARNGGMVGWMNGAHSALALVILLDQFPLNMFRGKPESFATEAMSREVAKHAIEHAYDELLSDDEKKFLYMPFMHSENPADQDLSVSLFEKAGLADNLKWAKHHREIINQFGRFPHRNNILGRVSTPEETEYLNSDSAFKG